MTYLEAAELLEHWLPDFREEYSKRIANAIEKAIAACREIAPKEEADTVIMNTLHSMIEAKNK